MPSAGTMALAYLDAQTFARGAGNAGIEHELRAGRISVALADLIDRDAEQRKVTA